MQYMVLIASDEDAWAAMAPEARREAYAGIERWFEAHTASGEIVSSRELQPSGTATTVRVSGGSATVTDGPFLEAKEMIGGFAIIDIADLDAAIRLASSWPGSDVLEIRPVAR